MKVCIQSEHIHVTNQFKEQLSQSPFQFGRFWSPVAELHFHGQPVTAWKNVTSSENHTKLPEREA